MIDLALQMDQSSLFQQLREDLLSWVLFFVFIMIMNLYGSRIQSQVWMGQISRALNRLDAFRLDAKKEFSETVSRFGRRREEIKGALDRFTGFFVSGIATLDPLGAFQKLEHILDLYRDRMKSFISDVAPEADVHTKANLRDFLGSVIVLDEIFRMVRHFFLLGKKTQNLIYIAQIQMQLPEILRIALAFRQSTHALKNGIPIGDGIGPLVAIKLIGRSPVRELAEGVVGADVNIEGRQVLVVKAEGPGGKIGKPGEAIKGIVESRNGNITRIIMIDAARKLEGEKTGEVVEGVGAFIGGLGVEKWKIEEAATKYAIPLDGIAIKEDLLEAITAMKPEIAKVSDGVVERVTEMISRGTTPGDFVIVAGVGNSIGIGNRIEGEEDGTRRTAS